MRQAAWLASNAPLHWQRVGKAVRKKNQVMYKAHHPPPKKGLRTQKKNTKKQTKNQNPPTPKLFFSFFCSFLLFPFFVLVFCFCVVSFFVAKKEQKTMRILFLFISTAPHSTQHTAQSTGHRAQSTHTHTHTHTHKYCIMKPSGPSWNTRLFRDK